MHQNSISLQGMSMDCLNTLKFFSVSEASNILESSSPQIRQKFQRMAQEHQSMAGEWFQLMHRRGWYPVSEARPESINQTLSHISSLQSGISQSTGMYMGQQNYEPHYGQQYSYGGHQSYGQQTVASQDKNPAGTNSRRYLT